MHYLNMNELKSAKKFFDKFMASRLIFDEDQRYFKLLNEYKEIVDLLYVNRKFEIEL